MLLNALYLKLFRFGTEFNETGDTETKRENDKTNMLLVYIFAPLLGVLLIALIACCALGRRTKTSKRQAKEKQLLTNEETDSSKQWRFEENRVIVG